MKYINKQTLQVLTEGEIRSLNPNTSFPLPFVPPQEYSYIFPSPQPSFNPLTEYVQESTPVLTQLGHYEQQWIVATLPLEQQELNLQNLRSTKMIAIKTERDRRKFNGVFTNNKWIHSDTYSRTQWLGMVMMGANLPVIEWTTMDGTTINTTPALAQAVFQGTATLDATLFGFAKALAIAVNESNDPGSIDITTGWPATFGE